MKQATPSMVTAHILFIDAVGYSTLSSDQQPVVFRQLQEFVGDCSALIDASAQDKLVRSPSGDGMALVFFDHCSSPLRCACELMDRIEKEGAFKVRMGIHTGEVARLVDINGVASVSGDGMNTAQRVMDFGDGGHILMSLQHATCLQAVRDPAANECYDIGIATAKHGKRIHLFNFHRPAVGSPDVPIKVRQDDQWARPKTLRLGTSGRNAFFASFQILGWLLTSPFHWRTHVSQIDPRLTPNFSIIDLTGAQIWRNRDLRQLLIQVYLISPGLLSLLIWAVLGPLGLKPIWWIGTLWAMGLLSSVLLGVGASLISFVLMTFSAVVQAPAIGFFGYASAANQIALSAVCVWAVVALSAVFPSQRLYSALREILAALASFVTVLSIWITIAYLAAGRPAYVAAGIVAAGGFVLITVIVGLRWGRWSRGFVFGQILGLITGAGTISIAGATPGSAAYLLNGGINNGLADAIFWAAAFSIGEKLAGARAAVMGSLIGTAFKNVAPTVWAFLPLISIWTAYAIVRHRSLARSRNATEALAGS